VATIAESAGLVMRRRTIGFDVCFTVGASDRHVCAAERCYLPAVVNGFVLAKSEIQQQSVLILSCSAVLTSQSLAEALRRLVWA
jgi:hypothetical protein